MTRILVIDDEIQIRELLRRALGGEGFEVITAPSAAQALERIMREPFDLILSDIRLPDESGISVLKKIRALDAKIPVIIYSGAITAELEKEARAAGASEVLAKNIGILQLTAQIKRFVKAKERSFSESGLRKERKILIVDDDASVRGMLVKFLKDKGFATLEAENGEQALRIVSSEKISVVLLDIAMPGMDGLTTLKKLLEINPKLGVVMATVSQGDEQVKKALELGAYGYVLKPFDFLYLELVVLSKLAIAETD